MDISKAKQRQRPRAKRKRIGRGPGSGHGKTSGRGRDGAHSRSGWSSRGMSGGNTPLLLRLPKVGFSNARFKKTYTVVNVAQLARFEAGAEVTLEALKEKGIVKQVESAGVKLLGNGEISQSLTVRVDAVSKSAQEKIEAAGGTVQLIPGPKKPVRNKMRPRAPRAAEEEL